MTFKQFNKSVLLVLLSGSLFAQKVDKKFSEKFYTNNDVVIDINASNAEIDVTTWNKNEVMVKAVIEVEGIDKKEAEKYLDSWKFEALGNKAKVKINANSNSFRALGRNNFVLFNKEHHNFPGVHLFDHDDEDVIVIPDVDIDVDQIIHGLEDIEFDFDKYANDGGNYFFQWKDGVNDITIKSKKEWEKFKKSKEYKKFKKSQEKRKKELKSRLEKRREAHKKRLEEHKKHRAEQREVMAMARAEARKAKRELLEAKRNILIERRKNSNGNSFSYSFSTDSNDFMINDKKVKITKKIIIKVPKNATFDLNTRHCKVKLPKTKVNGKVSYGNFKADAINGGKLNVSFSPTIIKTLNACTLFLNNVTDATLASVANTKLEAKSSEVTIEKILKNVEVTNRYGELTILNVDPNYESLQVLLNSSNAAINLSAINDELVYTIGQQSPRFIQKPAMEFSVNDKTKKINGNFTLSTNNKKLEIKGKYTQLAVHE